MAFFRWAASFLLLALSGTATAASPLGLPFDAQIEFEPGAAFDLAKVPLREDALEMNRRGLLRYASAAAPKALAVSEDGAWTGLYVPPAESRGQGDSQDARRLALQSCQFASGLRCRLVAVDDRMSARVEQLVEALPSGEFTANLFPWWYKSSALARGHEIVRDYLSRQGDKAFVMAQFAGARVFFDTGASIAAAREAALRRCATTVTQPNVRCVVLAENDRFVIRDLDARRVALTGQVAPNGQIAERINKITVLYVGAHNCPPCNFWSRTKKPGFLDSALGKSVEYREVIAATFNDTRGTATWPDDIKWIRDQAMANSGTPRWIILVDGKVVRNIRGGGNWDTDAIPYLQQLAKRKSN